MNRKKIAIKYLDLSSGLGFSSASRIFLGLIFFAGSLFSVEVYQLDASLHFVSNAKAFADCTSIYEMNHENKTRRLCL